MTDAQTTCWTVIEAAADGGSCEREEFAKTYLAVVRAYLNARWRNSTLEGSLDDATQEVFVECYRKEGPLAQADRERPGGFRAFLFGIVRNVARRFEEQRQRRQAREGGHVDLERVANDETQLSQVFDRAWAKTIMKQAADLQAQHAIGSDSALLRVELLRARFQEGLPIREIAELWNEDAAILHREYAKARSEFKAALIETVAFHRPNSMDKEIHQECAMLLDLLR